MGSPGASTYSPLRPTRPAEDAHADLCAVLEGEIVLVLRPQEVKLKRRDRESSAALTHLEPGPPSRRVAFITRRKKLWRPLFPGVYGLDRRPETADCRRRPGLRGELAQPLFLMLLSLRRSRGASRPGSGFARPLLRRFRLRPKPAVLALRGRSDLLPLLERFRTGALQAERWTNTSFEPSSVWIKPKPFSALNPTVHSPVSLLRKQTTAPASSHFPRRGLDR